jgi:hypothetical protein
MKWESFPKKMCVSYEYGEKNKRLWVSENTWVFSGRAAILQNSCL